jgi:hypothetical protein
VFQTGTGIDKRPFTGWQASVGWRWLHSDRHYVGTDYHAERAEERSQVINDMNTIDFSMTYSFDPRFSLTLAVPYVDNNRGSAIRRPANIDPERTTVGRSNVSASGIGDMRLSANYWLWDPLGHSAESHPAESTGKTSGKAPAGVVSAPSGRRGNIRLSIGVDMPTGEKDAKDYRRVYDASAPGEMRVDPNPVIVDQSIQPGDGGWGIPIDIFGYYNFTDRLNLYYQGSYLITPERDNGVRTGRGGAGEAIMSIGDVFMARAGLDYLVSPEHGLSFSLGLRTEGQPSEDLFGSSMDFRRPGMNIAVEPGITYMKNGWSASLLWPIVFYNNRFQSIPDQNASPTANGGARHGDAAFAQSYVMFVVGKQF